MLDLDALETLDRALAGQSDDLGRAEYAPRPVDVAAMPEALCPHLARIAAE